MKIKAKPNAPVDDLVHDQIEIPEPTLDGLDIDDLVSPGDIVRVQVTGFAKNPRFVYANLDTVRIPVRCVDRHPERLRNKHINVLVGINEAEELTYTQQANERQ